MRKTSAIVIAVPPAAATLAVVTFCAIELVSHTPLSYGPLQNVAEATAMGSASEVVRFVDAGQDVHQVWPIRADIISSDVTRATALEAAIWGRSPELMEILERRGLIADAAIRRHLACLADDIQAEEIAEHLFPDGPLECVPQEALKAVVARSKQP